MLFNVRDVEIEPGCGNWAWVWKLSLLWKISFLNVTAVEIEPGCGNWACCGKLAFLMSLLWKLSLDVEIEPAAEIEPAILISAGSHFHIQTQFPHSIHSKAWYFFCLTKKKFMFRQKRFSFLLSLRESILKNIHFYIIPHTRERKFSEPAVLKEIPSCL